MSSFAITKLTVQKFSYFSRRIHISPLTPKVVSEVAPHIKIFFNAQEAKPLPPLGPVIAMFQLNMSSVCKDLNTASADFPAGLEVRALIFKGKNKTYNIVVRPPTLKFLLEQGLLTHFSDEDLKTFQEDEESSPAVVPSTLSVEVLYDVFFLHWLFSFNSSKILNNPTLPVHVAKQCFSTLASMSGFIKKISDV
jgi:ribosomal protein L11